MMSTSVMLNNNVGIPNNLNVGVGSAAMVHHGGPPSHAPPIHPQSHGHHGTVTVSNVNVPFGGSGSGPPIPGPGGGPMPPGSRPGMGIIRPHHHFAHPHPLPYANVNPVTAPPTPAAPAAVSIPMPVASTSSASSSSGSIVANNGNGNSNNSTTTPMEVDTVEEVDTTPLTAAELQILSDIDSRCFGFLKLSLPENAKKKALVVKAVNQIERLLQEAQELKDSLMEGATREEIYIENKTYSKLGHFHLLLEDYEKALSAYQKYFSLISGEYWIDSPFMYGLGIVYFHFNCYSWATKVFLTLVYVDPGFNRANEARLRIACMKKVTGDFQGSLKHFKLALADQSPCTLSSFEIRFHIAHLHEISEKPKNAKALYEQLLKEKDLPAGLRADIHRQLGWMFHNVDALGEKQQREPIAIHFLEKSLQTEPKSGHTLYLLGRCFASIGRVHDAFIAYRNSVDKSEGNADTWCSIGVLYQQQNQPLDALQAYICAVQLDKFHVAAWTNLGILYESVSQPKDALACYVNASRGFYSQKNKKPMNPSLAQRVQFLQTKLANVPPQTLTNKTSQLPVIENAWNLPISAEMTARQQQQQQAQRQAMYAQQQKGSGPVPNSQYGGGNGVSQNGVPAKRFKTEEPVHGTSPQVVSRNSAPPPCLTQQQLQTLQLLQQSVQAGQQLTPTQQQYFAQLQQQYRLSQQYQQQQQSQARSGVSSFPSTASPRPASSPHSVQSAQPELSSSSQSQSFGGSTDVSQNNQDSMDRSTPRSSGALSTSPFSPNVSDQELQAWLTQGKDLGDDDLLKNVDLDEFDLMDDDELTGSNNNSLHSINNNNITEEKSGGNRDRALRAIHDADQKISVVSSRNVSSPVDSEPLFHIGMSAKELKDRVKGLNLKGVRNESIVGDNLPPPSPPEPPKMKLTEDQLYPQTPSVFVDNKKDAFSPHLQEFCLHHPIAVVRGIATALKLDLGLFSTKTLVEANPDHPVEIRAQQLQSADENHDGSGKKVWNCYSHRSQTTIQKYASYQASSFKDSVEEENDKAQGSQQNSDSDSKDSSGNPRKRKKMLKFGTNVDLSDERKWKEQLMELQKLPAFARVVSAGNMLSHVGHVILGMNTVQLYMKVPGSRTPGHQENNNFCSININIGPGDCEWFAVPDAYWGAIQKLCELNNINYLHGSWWPDLKDCAKAGIPVYRFTQKPGDLVWVNSGCVHWVQAIGWCNNIAWNVGPLTARQYQLGIERYEWNKLQSFKSIVPMVHLSWNLARNLKFSEHNQKLFELIKNTLMRTLTQCFKLLEFARSNKIEVRFHGRQKNDASHYCGQCEIEVFNVLFIREQERRHVVHCIDCARKASPNLSGFMCLEEYKLEDLMAVYDNFILHAAPPPPTTTVSISASSSTIAPPPTTSHHSQDSVASSSSSITAATPVASTSSL